jgi:putative copper resistance protein D
MALAHVDDTGGLDPLTWSSLLTESSVEALPAALIATAAVLYIGGVRRLSRKGRRWSPARSLAFATGVVALVVGTQSGLAAYDNVLFSAHAAQHVMIGVVAPFFLALGAPITLALQASSRTTQVGMLRILHSSVVQTLSHPIVAWSLFALSLFVLYFTPIYEMSLRNGLVHELVHLHFIVAGSVFFWAVIGLDPIGRRIPYGFRLLLVLLTVPLHAFLGLALLSASEPIAADHYASVERPTDVSVLGDQRTGAAVMWGIGDVIGFVAGGVVLAQWMIHDERGARRRDARLDRAEATRAAGPTP